MLRAILVLTIAAASGLGCTTIKPYEKEYLLHPLMDDAEVAKLSSTLTRATQSRNERLSAKAGASSGGSSCPTCGG